ncbi:MAG: hypothetical protein GY862_22600 [Gammaproteobacteria bacterium]|nr:hypothetical protein [Gammaproteobacteria bacterium]
MLGAGVEYTTNAEENPADILALTGPLLLNPTQSTGTLWLMPSNLLRTDSPAVQIRRPVAIGDISNRFADGREQVELELPREFMDFNDMTGAYEFTYSDFDMPGRYDIFYTLRDDRPVIDPETGRVIGPGKEAPVRHSVVYKSRPDDNPPPPVTLIYPLDGAETGSFPVFDWLPVQNPSGKQVNYALLIGNDDGYVAYQALDLSVTRHAVTEHTQVLIDPIRYTFHNGLRDLTEYYWMVAALDAYGAYGEAIEIRRFKVDNNLNRQIGYNPYSNSELYPPAVLYGEILTLPVAGAPCEGTSTRYDVWLQKTESGVFALGGYEQIWGTDPEEACFDGQQLHIPKLEGDGGGRAAVLNFNPADGTFSF